MDKSLFNPIDPSYRGLMVLEDYFLKRKSLTAKLKGYIKRYFILDLNQLSFSYKTTAKSSKPKISLPIANIIRVSSIVSGNYPPGHPYALNIEWHCRLFELFSKDKQASENWVYALGSINTIPSRPLQISPLIQNEGRAHSVSASYLPKKNTSLMNEEEFKQHTDASNDQNNNYIATKELLKEAKQTSYKPIENKSLKHMVSMKRNHAVPVTDTNKTVDTKANQASKIINLQTSNAKDASTSKIPSQIPMSERKNEQKIVKFIPPPEISKAIQLHKSKSKVNDTPTVKPFQEEENTQIKKSNVIKYEPIKKPVPSDTKISDIINKPIQPTSVIKANPIKNKSAIQYSNAVHLKNNDDWDDSFHKAQDDVQKDFSKPKQTCKNDMELDNWDD